MEEGPLRARPYALHPDILLHAVHHRRDPRPPASNIPRTEQVLGLLLANQAVPVVCLRAEDATRPKTTHRNPEDLVLWTLLRRTGVL